MLSTANWTHTSREKKIIDAFLVCSRMCELCEIVQCDLLGFLLTNIPLPSNNKVINLFELISMELIRFDS